MKAKWILALLSPILFGHISRNNTLSSVQTALLESLAVTFSFINQSASPFSAVQVKSNNQLLHGDFDNDGDQDLLIIPQSNVTYSEYWQNNGNQTFTKISGSSSPFRNLPNESPIYTGTQYAFVADWDQDGDDDIFVTKRTTSGENKFYRNDNGLFVELSGSSSPFYTISIFEDNFLIYGDFDNDGDIDLATLPNSSAIAHDYWRNKGNGTFEKITGNGNPFNGISDKAVFYTAARFAYVKDWDNDGDVDIFVTRKNTSGQNLFYRNDNGSFTELSGTTSPFKDIVIDGNEHFIYGDFDGDGDIDIDASPGLGAPNDYWRNNGNATFTKLAPTVSPFYSLPNSSSFALSARSVRVADWDNDGDDDIYVTKYNATESNVFIRQEGAIPTILTKTPAHNATNVATSSNLTLNFSSPVSVVAGKQIQIKKVTDNSIVSTIQTNSSAITGSSTATITINPSTDLPSATQLYILIDKGAFANSDGRIHLGLANPNNWIFTTKTAPTIPTVTTELATSISMSSAILGGNIINDGGGVVYERGIEWFTSGNPTPNKIVIGSGVGSFSQNITSLPSATLIYAKAFAKNEAGTSYGTQIIFYTSTAVESILSINSSPTNSSTVDYEVKFAHIITGLDTSDFALTGTTGSTITSVTGSGRTYTVTITTGNTNGQFSLNFTNPTGIHPNAATFSSVDKYTIYKQTNTTDRFRTSDTNGSWHENATWESSADNSLWINATAAPSAHAQQVTIESGYELTLFNGINAVAKNVSNSGTIHTGQQSLTISETFLNSGTIRGNGTIINSSWINSGIIAPGSSPGVLTSEGDLTNEGELVFEIGGTSSTEYDHLLINGEFSAGGTLRISFINGFTPSPGDNFQLISSTDVVNTFDTVIVPENETVYSWELQYGTDGSVALHFKNPLPVTLSYFTVTKEGFSTQLQWETTEEVNSAYFEIEYSRFKNEWRSVGRVEAKGNSQALSRYSFIHPQAGAGTLYYRLKMVDKDGTFSYSSIKSIKIQSTEMAIYPNPALDVIHLPRELMSNVYSFRIFTTSGVSVYNSSLVTRTAIDVKSLSSGLYLIEITNPSSQSKFILKFVKL